MAIIEMEMTKHTEQRMYSHLIPHQLNTPASKRAMK